MPTAICRHHEIAIRLQGRQVHGLTEQRGSATAPNHYPLHRRGAVQQCKPSCSATDCFNSGYVVARQFDVRIGASVRILLYLNEHFLVGCLCEYVGVTLSVDRNDTPTQPYDRVSKQRLHAVAEFRVPAFLAQVLEEGVNLEITDFQCAGPTMAIQVTHHHYHIVFMIEMAADNG